MNDLLILSVVEGDDLLVLTHPKIVILEHCMVQDAVFLEPF